MLKLPMRYEQILVRPADIFLFCEKAINNGEIIANGASVSLDKSPDWFCDHGRGRSFLFHLHAWDPIDVFFIAHAEKGTPEILDRLIHVTADWCHTFDTLDITGQLIEHGLGEDLIWYDMAAGMRIYRLAYLIDVLRQEAREEVNGQDTRELLSLYENALNLHREFLGNNENFRTNNHGMYQAFGQMAAGCRLRKYDLPGMDEMRQQGEERFARLVEMQFSPEGIHTEHSPYYHEAVCRILKQVIEADLLEDKSLAGDIGIIVNNLAWFITPDNHLVNLGDTDFEPASSAYEYLKPALSQGETLIGFFPKTGYWVVRNQGEKGENYLCQASAFHSRTHKHADDCTMIWYENGEQILIDGGRYGYVGKQEKNSPLWLDGYWYADPNRVYVERSRAHNVIEVNDRNHPRFKVKPYGSGLVNNGKVEISRSDCDKYSQAAGGTVYFSDSEARSLKSVRHLRVIPAMNPTRHFRVLAYLPGAWLLCVDVLRQKGEFSTKQWFNFAPRFDLDDVRGPDVFLTDPVSQDVLQITSLADNIEMIETARGWIGESHNIYPGMLGWHSPKAGVIKPNRSLAFGSTHLRDTWLFATLLSLKPFTADRAFTRINQSGRRGRFRWDMDGMTYTLSYIREKKSGVELSVEVRPL